MNTKDKINQIATEWLVAHPNLFVVDIVITNKGKQRIMVLLDGNKGVTIDECASLSRRIGYILEQENSIEEAYILEVSSPGVGYPLQLQRQYVANLGRKLKVELTDGSTAVGKIDKVETTHFVIELEQKKLSAKAKKALTTPPDTHKQIAFEQVKKAVVQIEFE